MVTTGSLDANPQFKAFAASIRYAVIVANENGIIVDHNPAALIIFGYEEDELRGQPLTILMPERFRNGHVDGLRRFTTTRVPKLLGTTFNIYAQHKDGHEFPIEIALSSWQAYDEQYFTGCIRNFSKLETYARWAIFSSILMVAMLAVTISLLLLELL